MRTPARAARGRDAKPLDRRPDGGVSPAAPPRSARGADATPARWRAIRPSRGR